MAKRKPHRYRVTLEKACATLDRDAIRLACEALIEHIRTSKTPFPRRDAEKALDELRSVREFEQMQRVGDVFIQAGRGSFRVRRHYGQSQLELGNITAAIKILQQMAKDCKGKDRGEYEEAQGLLGRAYKQLYIDAGSTNAPWVVDALKKSIRHYYRVYREDKKKLWHGINTVAMMQRAEHDGVRLPGYPSTRTLAADIRDTVARKRKRDSWDIGTAAEANVGLGDFEEALRLVYQYVADKEISAFHLGSFERQLREVWGMKPDTLPGELILPLVRRELLRREGASLDVSIEETEVDPAQRSSSELQLEKILGKTGVKSYRWWLTALERARGVARIGLDTDRGEGTGFLVRGSDLAPTWGEELVLVTNAHVVSNNLKLDVPIRPDEAVITFEAKDEGRQIYEAKKQLFTSPPGALDVTVLQLNRPVEDIEPIPLHHRLPTPKRGRVYIIGHPQGGTLSFSIQDNRLIGYKESKLHYRAPTEPGSSGSPVFNAQWKLIGLHHAGGHNVKKLTGKGTYAANEGIWIESIRKAIQLKV